MGFNAIGIIMLVVVFVFYMRMIDARAAARQRKHQVTSILEKAEIFESVAQDEHALAVINEGLVSHPENSQLLNKAQELKQRLAH